MMNNHALTARTVNGIEFDYTGSLADGLIIYFRRSGTRMPISPRTVSIIRNEIATRSPVPIGANRDGVTDSVGKTLRTEHGLSPQHLSYVVPLLVDEGFCRVEKEGRAFILRTR